jgi:hypothetical protein
LTVYISKIGNIAVGKFTDAKSGDCTFIPILY